MEEKKKDSSEQDNMATLELMRLQHDKRLYDDVFSVIDFTKIERFGIYDGFWIFFFLDESYLQVPLRWDF